MKQKTFYITTPIYYPSGKPHIGHAYTTILADVIKRYKQLQGYETFFLTGTDEHGKKIQQAAEKANVEIMQYLDNNVQVFIDLWKKLGIKYDKFIRTTNEDHCLAVQKIFTKFYNQNLIYLDQWSGLYCVSCEENLKPSECYTKNDILVCQHGHQIVDIQSESYFFKMAEQNNWLLDYYHNHPDFLIPAVRTRELVSNFLSENKLTDLSISRSDFDWGIKINENPKHVVYVWMDALMNYITGLGYLSCDDTNFKKFWLNNDAEIVHLMSKEITRFHCIYWPAFLKHLNLRFPTKILSHGWIVTKEGKMSKSLGNVINPYDLLNKYNRDTFRYCLMKDMSTTSDNVFSEETLIGTYNGDLANNYGNLVSRSLGMLTKYFNKVIPSVELNVLQKINVQFIDHIKNANQVIQNHITNFKINHILLEIQNLINHANKMIEDYKPWELFKNDDNVTLSSLMVFLFKVIEVATFWLQPVLIDGVSQVLNQTNLVLDYTNLDNILSVCKITVNDSSPIYLRINNK